MVGVRSSKGSMMRTKPDIKEKIHLQDDLGGRQFRHRVDLSFCDFNKDTRPKL